MKVDIGEALMYAWQISWKHKTLWWYGIFLGLAIFAMFPLMFAPMFFPLLIENFRPEMFIGFTAIFIVFFAGLMILLYPVSAVLQGALTVGVLQADQSDEPIVLVETFKKSLSFFWRILGIMGLYAVAYTLLSILLQIAISVLTIVTFGFGMLCMIPLMLLFYPVMFLSIVWMEQSINGVIIDDMTIMEAVKQGWQIIRENLLTIVILLVVVYFGVSMVTGVFMIPIMVPFFAIPFSMLEGDVNWTVLSISLLCTVAFTPVFAVINGWALAFIKSAWVYTYLRLTRPSNEPQPMLQETPA